MKIICRFCNRLAEKQETFYTYTVYQCNNHPLKVKFICYEDELNYRIAIKGLKYNISFYNNFDKNMYLKMANIKTLELGLTLPFDNSLTPENFEQKLKLYLTFM